METLSTTPMVTAFLTKYVPANKDDAITDLVAICQAFADDREKLLSPAR